MWNISKYLHWQPDIRFVSDHTTHTPLNKTHFDYALMEYLFCSYCLVSLVYSLVPFLLEGVNKGESCKDKDFCGADSVCDAGDVCREYYYTS